MNHRPPLRRIDGVLLLDKPSGITSNAALQRARRAFRARKAGHTGTLDPMASGLLPVCFGEATKFSSGGLEADKTYQAQIRLGVDTDTGDAEGEVIAERPVCVDDETLARALDNFRGEIDQLPPMHSAIKRDGRPLYELARRGLEVPRETRRVTIRRLELRERRADRLSVEVECSKGTYVRALATDLGAALGCGAHLCGLRRVAIGALNVAQAIPLDVLESLDEPGRLAALLPVDVLVSDLLRVDLDADAARRFGLGQAVSAALPSAPARVRVYGAHRLLGLGDLRQDGRLAPARLVSGLTESSTGIERNRPTPV